MLLTYITLLSVALTAYARHVTRQDASGPPVVDVGYATYQGVRLAAGVDQFLGMRYASPPLGDLRFRAPRDPPSVSAVQSASRFQPICVGYGQTPSSSIAEDCLFVNVFKPSNATEASKLPVWVYIQGGGYRTNSNSNYNGTNVVQQSSSNIVFVNFNYRVGALGFLASKRVRKDGDLNVGLLDQRQLLMWVQKHIAKFGGDPDHVVIHGASAGAGSVAHHLVAYGGRNDKLFTGAALQSPFLPTQRTVADTEFQFDGFVNKTSCIGHEDSLTCLRSLNLTEILAASVVTPFPGAEATPLPLWYWLPVIDGDLIPDHLYTLFEQGKFIRVPTLVGGDTDEGSSFAYNSSNESQMSTFFKNNYPKLRENQLQQINEAYPLMPPLPRHAAYFPSTSAAYGDATFTCPGNEMAASIARYLSPEQVWDYRFNVQDPDRVAAGLGVPHTFETSAIFGVGFAGSAAPSYSGINAAIVPITMHYWISFIRTLNPNHFRLSTAPLWKSWGQADGQRLKLETNATAMEEIPSIMKSRCQLWKEMADTMEV